MTRQSFDDFYGDAVYEAWRSGLNPDRVDYDRAERHYYADHEPESVARELRREDDRRREAREAEEYYEAMGAEPGGE